MTIAEATDQQVATEAQLRVDLAATYRAIAMYGWDDLIFTHISVRIPGPDHHFLINPYGMMFREITASSLVKIDLDGNKVDPSPYEVNPAGFVIHSAIHAAREDAQCVLHVHNQAGIAVSCQEEGVLPISQQASIVLASVAYHDYEGIALRDEEKPRLVADMGTANNLILRNHGLLTVGTTCAEAFLQMYNLIRTCEIQVMAMSAAGGRPLRPINPMIIQGVGANIEAVLQGMGTSIAWPGILRTLDSIDPSYRN